MFLKETNKELSMTKLFMPVTLISYDVADHSRTRHAGVTAWPADRALLQAQCAAGDVMSVLPPTGQARRLCHGQTATCEKFWTIQI